MENELKAGWEQIEENVFYAFQERWSDLKIPCHIVKSKDDSRRVYYSALYCDKKQAIENFKKKKL